MKKPKISILMSEYNTELNLLYKSIQSIVEQTYNNWELIIIDDAGKNDLGEIIKRFNDDRIKIYKNSKNMGLVYSLNKAIKMSTGDYVARMDTDDYSFKDRIEKQISFLLENDDYDIVSGRCCYYDESNGIWGISGFNGEVTRDVMLNGNVIIHPTVMCRKNIFDKTGGYLNYRRCEDTATWFRLFSLGCRFYVLDDVLIKYHLSFDDMKKRTLFKRLDAFESLKKEYIKLNPSNLQILKRYAKLIISAVMPPRIMFSYHKRKAQKALCSDPSYCNISKEIDI